MGQKTRDHLITVALVGMVLFGFWLYWGCPR